MYRTTDGHSGCGTDSKDSQRHIHIQKRPYGQIQCSHHGVGPLSLSPPYTRRSKHSNMKTGRHQHGIKAMLHLTFPPNPNPNVDIPQGRTKLGGLTEGINLTQSKSKVKFHTYIAPLEVRGQLICGTLYITSPAGLLHPTLV